MSNAVVVFRLHVFCRSFLPALQILADVDEGFDPLLLLVVHLSFKIVAITFSKTSFVGVLGHTRSTVLPEGTVEPWHYLVQVRPDSQIFLDI